MLTKALIDKFNHDEVYSSQESQIAAQIIVSNATKRTKIKKDQKFVRRHRKCQETPLLIYSSLKINSTCFSTNIIDLFSSIGQSGSYDSILELTKNIYEHLQKFYYNYNCFFPKLLKKAIFRIMMKDNIDMNARSAIFTALEHRGSLSIVWFPTNEKLGLHLANGMLGEQSKKYSEKISPLPVEYENIKILFALPANPDKRLWITPKTPIDVSDQSVYAFT